MIFSSLSKSQSSCEREGFWQFSTSALQWLYPNSPQNLNWLLLDQHYYLVEVKLFSHNPSHRTNEEECFLSQRFASLHCTQHALRGRKLFAIFQTYKLHEGHSCLWKTTLKHQLGSLEEIKQYQGNPVNMQCVGEWVQSYSKCWEDIGNLWLRSKLCLGIGVWRTHGEENSLTNPIQLSIHTDVASEGTLSGC